MPCQPHRVSSRWILSYVKTQSNFLTSQKTLKKKKKKKDHDNNNTKNKKDKEEIGQEITRTPRKINNSQRTLIFSLSCQLTPNVFNEAPIFTFEKNPTILCLKRSYCAVQEIKQTRQLCQRRLEQSLRADQVPPFTRHALTRRRKLRLWHMGPLGTRPLNQWTVIWRFWR